MVSLTVSTCIIPTSLAADLKDRTFYSLFSNMNYYPKYVSLAKLPKQTSVRWIKIIFMPLPSVSVFILSDETHFFFPTLSTGPALSLSPEILLFMTHMQSKCELALFTLKLLGENITQMQKIRETAGVQGRASYVQ